jgi:hypothetical protein
MTANTASTATAPHAIVAARRPWLACSASHRNRCARPLEAGELPGLNRPARNPAPGPVLQKTKIPGRALYCTRRRAPVPTMGRGRHPTAGPRPLPPRHSRTKRALRKSQDAMRYTVRQPCLPPNRPGRRRHSSEHPLQRLPPYACPGAGSVQQDAASHAGPLSAPELRRHAPFAPTAQRKNPGRNALHREIASPPTEPAGAAAARSGNHPLQRGTVRPDGAPRAGPLSAPELRRHAPLAPDAQCKNPGRNALHRETALPSTQPAGAAAARSGKHPYNVARCDRTPRRKPDRFQPPSFAAAHPTR